MENEVLAKAVVASKFRSSKLDIRIKKEIKANVSSEGSSV